MEYIRLYEDASGETHFEDVPVPLKAADFAPPAPPLYLSDYNAAERYAFCRFPPGWCGDWHPAPRHQVFFLLSGEMEAQTSDGEVRHLTPGAIVLLEDTTGKGHMSRVVGTGEALSAVVQLPQ